LVRFFSATFLRLLETYGFLYRNRKNVMYSRNAVRTAPSPRAAALFTAISTLTPNNGFLTDNTTASGNGHAVYVSSEKKRNSTVEENKNLDSGGTDNWDPP
jgi:hypothetical protein